MTTAGGGIAGYGPMGPGGGNVPATTTVTTEDMPRRTSPYVELGVTGLKRWSGYVDEEFLPALRGRKAVQIYKEMSENDAIVGALMFSIDMLIRAVDWHVQPASSANIDQAAAKFVESCMEDMSHTWDEFITEVLSCLIYGWSWHEVIYKKRNGTNRNQELNSNFADGLIGWRKMPIRAQETWLQWVFDDAGETVGLVQLAPPAYQRTVIPRSKSLLFRTTPAKNNPEGRSLLRNAYRSWYFKKRLEEFEGIGIERDLAGLPVAYLPADYLNAAPGTPQAKMVDAFRRMVRSVRRDEQEGVLMPMAYDEDTKQPLYKFELMTSGGSRQFDTNTIIQRYEQRILMTVLADFIMVGHQDTGSYALHVDKTGIFRSALNAIVKSIADVLNRVEIPRLFALNGWNLDRLPEFQPTDVDPPDLMQLGAFIQQMTNAGMTFFPDQDLENFLRTTAKLPEVSPEVAAERDQQTAQEQAMQLAQQQLQLQQQQQGVAAGDQQMALSDQQAQLAQAQAAQAMDHAERGQSRQEQAAQLAAMAGQQGMEHAERGQAREDQKQQAAQFAQALGGYGQLQQMRHAEAGQTRQDMQAQISAQQAHHQAQMHQMNLAGRAEEAQRAREQHRVSIAQAVAQYQQADKDRRNPAQLGPGQGGTTGPYQHKR